MSESPKIPDGMKEVSRDEFFDRIGKLDVHPSPNEYCTEWKTPSGVVRGFSLPGYKNPGDKKVWALPR